MTDRQPETEARSATQRERLVTLFGRIDRTGCRRVRYVVDPGAGEYVTSEVEAEQPVASIAAGMPAASWCERETSDQFGIQFTGSPDRRPLLFHECWPAGVHPMVQRMNDIDWPPPDACEANYEFLRVQGEGVCEVPVGPVHAGIIEPGHFRFSVMGDRVLHLELRHFYTHKGTERLFRGCPISAGPMLAESVSGDNCFAHAVAYCQAVEAAFGVTPPARAQALRLIGLEVERLLAHIGDVGALCNDVAFVVAAQRAAALKEALLQASAAWIGTRYWRGLAAPGGLRRDVVLKPAAFRRAIAEITSDFAELAQSALETASVQDRFDGAGILPRQVARDFAVVGPVARASDVDLDVRRDHPYGAYRNLQLKVPVLHYGDVMARARIRIEEAAVSAELVEQALDALPAGPVLAAFDATAPADGYSAVESPRGELFYWVEANEGYLTRCHVKSPSFQNWPALPFAVTGNIIADFPLINKSFNLSYSGCDR